MPGTCSAADWVFSTRSGYGVPAGMYILTAFNYVTGARCERYGEVMTREEATAEGLRQGALIYFRDTESFHDLARHYKEFYSEERVRELARTEEVDEDQLVASVADVQTRRAA